MKDAPVLLLLLHVAVRWGSRFVLIHGIPTGMVCPSISFGVHSVFDPATMIYVAAKRLCFCTGLLGKKSMPQGVWAPCWHWLHGHHPEDAPGFHQPSWAR